MGRRIVIEPEATPYMTAYIEIPATPDPIQSWGKICSSIEEVHQAIDQLFSLLPRPIKSPEEVKRLEREGFKKRMLDDIEGRP